MEFHLKWPEEIYFNNSVCLWVNNAQMILRYWVLQGSDDTVTSHNDLGILFDDKLKFHDHTTKVTTKANRILGMIKKPFEYLDSGMLSKLFTTLVRPILEYGKCHLGTTIYP